jgi:excisionase family DNA binding protein
VLMTIGEVAQRLGVSQETVRYWEREGVARFARDFTNRRVMTKADFERLQRGRAERLRSWPWRSRSTN